MSERLAGDALHELRRDELPYLLSPRYQLPLLITRRAAMIGSRVRLWAWVFAALTPLWIAVDLMVFESAVAQPLSTARILASLAFLGLAWSLRGGIVHLKQAYLALFGLFMIPSIFFVYAYPIIGGMHFEGVASAVALGLAYLPFIVLAGLSIFPLTLLEGLVFSLPTLASTWLGMAWLCQCVEGADLAGIFWLLLVIAAVATLAGMSQLAFMIALVRQALRDGMTGAFTHQSGEELLDIQFILSTRNQMPLALAFIDLDNFKRVNDDYGHEAGDTVLIEVSARIREQLRMGDMLVRWGGEEFLLIMPNTSLESACAALRRLRESGLGLRPEGTPVTASVGVAERLAAGVADWRQLIAFADQAMYAAKRSGKDQILAWGSEAKPVPCAG